MIYIDHVWEHEDSERLFRALVHSLGGKRPQHELDAMLGPLDAYAESLEQHRASLREGCAWGATAEAVLAARAAVDAATVDALSSPYQAYVAGHSKNPGKSAFCALVRRGGRERQFVREQPQGTLEGIHDAGVDFVRSLLAQKHEPVAVFCLRACTRENVLPMPWNADGHRFFQRIDLFAYKAVYRSVLG